MNSLFFHLVVLSFLQLVISEYVNDTANEFHEKNEETRVLSRQKRFIIFPEGSSLQLVFSWQIAALIPIGDIFLFGNTVALAWELPSDTKLFTQFNSQLKDPLRRVDSKTINYLDVDGRIIGRVPYQRRIIVNPAFAKRSIDDDRQLLTDEIKIDKKKMHKRQLRRDYLQTDLMDKDTVEFDRSNRVGLYQKVETLLSGMGKDGRQCVLYKLCEAAQRAPKQGTFLQEIFRAVFTLPKGEEFVYDEHKEYDKAHILSGDCLTKYAGCEDLHESVLQ